MPELPEVETVRKTLAPLLRQQKIINVRIFFQKIIKEPDIDAFKNLIINKTFLFVGRKAKLLIFELDNDYVLLSHLRMEGKYYFQKKDEEIDWKHILLVLDLENGYQLRYHDTRRFGTFHLQTKTEYKNKKPFLNLGIEAIDENLTIDYLETKWKNKQQKIKTALLDQTIISGIGNIYANEILFQAKIHPETICKILNRNQLAQVILSAKKILTAAIENGGTTIASYTSSFEITGKFQNHLKVHLRKGENCFHCQTKISKISINGRGTYFCSNCQQKNNFFLLKS